MELTFLREHCSTNIPDWTIDQAHAAFLSLGLEFDPETRVLTFSPPAETFESIKIYTRVSKDETTNSLNRKYVGEWSRWVANFNGSTISVTLTDEQADGLIGFDVSFVPYGSMSSYKAESTAYFANLDDVGTLIYPTGIIAFDALPVTMVGFKGEQKGVDFTHIQIIVAEIQDDGTVGSEGHVWESPFYPKGIDYITTLENIINFCEGQEATRFNVSFHFVKENETGGFDFVRAHIVGDTTTETTFTVQNVELPTLSIDSKVYCLDPVIMTINRQKSPGIKFVRVEIGNYIADYEFHDDKRVLEIDIAEYLQTLFALVDVFQFQMLDTTIVVKVYNSGKTHMSTLSAPVSCVYGKKPEPEIPEHLRVQWLDKFGHLHDVIFKVFDKVAEGASAQKYVVNREEREDKTGERSISLAYVGANASQRIALETIVFSDHVRAYFDGNWKRVKVANSYKNGTGRITKNFEITIKYSI